MKIDKNKCIGCGICVHFCPSDAISIVDKLAVINQESCFECGNCIRNEVIKCPTKAIYEPEECINSEREIRRFFSDPATTHKATKISGRGTEEVKTNDVTGRVCRGEIGIAVEMGRPYVGTKVVDIERVCIALSKRGIKYEKNNPLTQLMADANTGEFKAEYRNELILSAIIEFTIPFEKTKEILNVIKKIANEIETVFSLDLICCFDDDYSIPVLPILDELNMPPRMNGKVNLGLGRPFKISRNEKGVN